MRKTVFVSLILVVLTASVCVTSVGAFDTNQVIYQPLVWNVEAEVKTYLSPGNDASIIPELSGGVRYVPDGHKYTFSSNATDPFTSMPAREIRIGNSMSGMDLVMAPDLYDYYVVIRMYSPGTGLTFYPTRLGFIYKNCNSTTTEYAWFEEATYYHYDNADTIGFSMVAKLPDDYTNVNFQYLRMISTRSLEVSFSWVFEGMIIAVNKDMSEENANSIIGAIVQGNTNIVDKLEEILSTDPEPDESASAEMSKVDEAIDELGSAEEAVKEATPEWDPTVLQGVPDDSGSALGFIGDLLDRVIDSAFGPTIFFCLSFGLAMTIIGRSVR